MPGFGIFSHLLATSGEFWQNFANFGTFWQLLAIFGYLWQILATLSIFWQNVGIFLATFGCPHKLVLQIEGDAGAVASKMASELIARIDTDGNGTLDEEEFLTVSSPHCSLATLSISCKLKKTRQLGLLTKRNFSPRDLSSSHSYTLSTSIS